MFLNDIRKQLTENERCRIVFLGDSLTSAEWIHPNWRDIIEYVLKEELSNEFEKWEIPLWGIKCINSGFNGSTTKNWVERLEKDVIEYAPDLVICMGTDNDKYFNISPEEHKENLLTILTRLRSKVQNVVFCTSIPANNAEYLTRYLPYYQKAKSIFPYKEVLFIDMLEEFKLYDLDSFFTLRSRGNEDVGIKEGDIDYVHPNQKGNAYIAKIILDKVFGLKFDPEKYMRSITENYMFPLY